VGALGDLLHGCHDGAVEVAMKIWGKDDRQTESLP
jgi:hypothetical protein